ncbi:putative major facilitator superfamily transporter [Rosellinia necatrix]|uniref:Putative major facilitator superfamily transporter n=1 Tax=Rosellinia necatrix TaxID=77044 RepID=A0A1W2TD46_ROSNE|nr:putative major facilitator superfamily transporter [Rosellinia necatrix]
MVGSGYDALNQDGSESHDASSQDSLDSPGHSTGDAGGRGFDAGDGGDSERSLRVVASRPNPLRINTGALAPNSSGDREIQRLHTSVDVVGWKELPRKDQLIVITLARLSEPLTQTSLQAYMFYQLRWFDPTLPDAVISGQAGVLHASFTAAQFFTAMLWGRVADSKIAGRKTVILIGLLGTLISCLGFGFSTSFHQALFFRSIGGITNGNIGVLRTMISETIREKKYQSRAFLILPMTFNIGVIIGPILGGILSDPAGSYPDIFGDVEFFKRFPYATPNIVSAVFLGTALLLCWLMLEETHDSLRDKRDVGIILGRKLRKLFRRDNNTIAYTPIGQYDAGVDAVDYELSPGTPRDSTDSAPKQPAAGRRYTSKLPFRRIFTRNVVFTFASHFFLAFHVGTFNSLWAVFLSTPVYDPADPDPAGFEPRPPFRFTGGLGLPPRSIGLAMALLGAIGILMQLFLYPRLSSRLGVLRSWRAFLFLFPVTYFAVPYLSVVPSSTAPPSQKTGPAVWAAIGGVLLVQVSARTFALPGQTILVNNCTPHPSVLSTVHGLGQSASSLARTIGPVAGGWLYGLGLSHGLVGGVFWGMTVVAIVGVMVSFWVREGNGHEIWLEGDVELEVDNRD